MSLSPPLSLSRSPSSSSIAFCSSGPSSLDQPSSPPSLVGQQYKLPSVYGSGQGYSMTPPMDPDPSVPAFNALCQPEWTGSALLHPCSTGSPMTNVISSSYVSYGTYDAALPPTCAQEIYQGHHVQSHSSHGSTLAHTEGVSQSIDASSRSTVSYTSAPHISGSPTPTMKLERAADYNQGLEIPHHPSPGSTHAAYATDSASHAGSTSGYLSDGQSSWRTSEYQARMEPDHYYDVAVAVPPFMQDKRKPYRGVRPRHAPRRLTTREEANFQCEVPGCGMLFGRSYNFKAHMETHDAKREYAFPCLAGGCNKKFVRKTDLQRHHQSVHMKERNHKCDYCGRPFARKDTLRRHMEDGCSKRFDLGTVDLRSEHSERAHSGTRQLGVGQPSLIGSALGCPPLTTMRPHGSSSSILTSTTQPMHSMHGRDSVADQSQEHSWGRH